MFAAPADNATEYDRAATVRPAPNRRPVLTRLGRNPQPADFKVHVVDDGEELPFPAQHDCDTVKFVQPRPEPINSSISLRRACGVFAIRRSGRWCCFKWPSAEASCERPADQ